MNDRDFFSEHLWDWLADGPGHEHHTRLQALLASDAGCASEHRAALALKAGLKGGQEPAPAGFEARLKARLADTLAAEQPAPVLVTPPASLWRRGPLLVLGGVAAVMAFALVGTWQAETPGPDSPATAVVEPAAGTAPAVTAPEQPTTGLLAERDFQQGRDSVATDSTTRTDANTDLTPVSRQRAAGSR